MEDIYKFKKNIRKSKIILVGPTFCEPIRWMKDYVVGIEPFFGIPTQLEKHVTKSEHEQIMKGIKKSLDNSIKKLDKKE